MDYGSPLSTPYVGLVICLVPGIGYAYQICEPGITLRTVGDLKCVCDLATYETVRMGLYVCMVSGWATDWYIFSGTHTEDEWTYIQDTTWLEDELVRLRSIDQMRTALGTVSAGYNRTPSKMESDEQILEEVLGRYVTTAQGLRDGVTRVETELAAVVRNQSTKFDEIMGAINALSAKLDTVVAMTHLSARSLDTTRDTIADDDEGQGRYVSAIYALAALLYSAIHISMDENRIKKDRLIVPKRSRFCSVARHLIKTPKDGYAPQVPDNKNPKSQSLMTAMMECGPSNDLFIPCSKRVLIAAVTNLGDTWSLVLSALVDRMKLCRHLLPQEMAWGLEYLSPRIVEDGRMVYVHTTLPDDDEGNVFRYKHGSTLKEVQVKSYVEKVLSFTATEIKEGKAQRLLDSMA